MRRYPRPWQIFDATTLQQDRASIEVVISPRMIFCTHHGSTILREVWQEDAEQMFTILTAPYVRIPLILEFFAQERAGSLFNEQLRELLIQALFEPREGVTSIRHLLRYERFRGAKTFGHVERYVDGRTRERCGCCDESTSRLLHNGARLCMPQITQIQCGRSASISRTCSFLYFYFFMFVLCRSNSNTNRYALDAEFKDIPNSHV